MKKFRKVIKYILIVLIVVIDIIVLDSMQALLFSNKPILSKKDEQKLYTLYSGILVRTYESKCNNKKMTIANFEAIIYEVSCDEVPNEK